jgi:hypothetical protein
MTTRKLDLDALIAQTSVGQSKRLRPVAILYVRHDSHYYGMPGAEPWSEAQDARKYAGPHSVVAHPPCGPWGNWAWKCKQDPTLAPLALKQVRRWGGVLAPRRVAARVTALRHVGNGWRPPARNE